MEEPKLDRGRLGVKGGMVPKVSKLSEFKRSMLLLALL